MRRCRLFMVRSSPRSAYGRRAIWQVLASYRHAEAASKQKHAVSGEFEGAPQYLALDPPEHMALSGAQVLQDDPRRRERQGVDAGEIALVALEHVRERDAASRWG